MNDMMKTILQADGGNAPSLPTLDAVKERYIAYLFEATQRDLRETARILRISPRTVQNRIFKASSFHPGAGRI